MRFKLQIVGDGSDKERFLAEAIRLGLNNDIKMCGTQSDVIPYYIQSDMLLLPSRWEGFGLVATEALECGLPVVSFRTEGPEEILTDGLAECLIDKYDTRAFADKVQSLLQNRSRLCEISEMAEVRARDFSVEAIIPQWNRLLSS